MEPAGDDLEIGSARGRALRAIAVITGSVLAIAAAGYVYARPTLPALGPALGAAPVAHAATSSHFSIAAVDFVDASTGWLVVTFDTGEYAVVRTLNSGRSWTEQLSGSSNPRTVYLKFFDRDNGVFGVTGVQPRLFHTFDGGATWSQSTRLGGSGVVMSWAFADPAHAWMLAGTSSRLPSTRLYRTADGGATWLDQGSPVAAPDAAYAVEFQDRFTGWLDTVSGGAYAYRSQDSGATWSKVALPAPPGGWPRTGEFFVAVQPTHQLGVVASVSNFAPVTGRSGIGGRVELYPPLTLTTFDGGVPVRYAYLTFTDQLTTDRSIQPRRPAGGGPPTVAPNQVELGSVDGGDTWNTVAPPAADGAIGYFDAWDWWWIGSGAVATSSDAGVTWSAPRKLAIVPPVAGSLEVLDQTHAWFAAAMAAPVALETTADGGRTWRMVFVPPLTP